MTQIKAIIEAQGPPMDGFTKVEFKTSDFEALIHSQGSRVYHEKALPCPCRVREVGRQPLASCRNCAGSGWVFINKFESRMIVRAMNASTQFKEWSKTNVGTASITAREADGLAFMDRITVADARSMHHEVLEVKRRGGIDRLALAYPAERVIEVFVFVSDGRPLRLIKADLYFFEGDIITFNVGTVTDGDAITIKYEHAPQFHIIDLVRETMAVTTKNAANKPVTVLMPISAVARRTHYVLDSDGNRGTIFDNSYSLECPVLPLTAPASGTQIGASVFAPEFAIQFSTQLNQSTATSVSAFPTQFPVQFSGQLAYPSQVLSITPFPVQLPPQF